MKKKILGITVLLAVVAMCLTFTACPPPEDNVVRFVNYTACKITITIKGGEIFDLQKLTSLTADPDSHTVTKSGDIVLQTIAFDNGTVSQKPEDYITIDGQATGGKKQYSNGINLGSGTINFRPIDILGNPAMPRINIIPQDD